MIKILFFITFIIIYILYQTLDAVRATKLLIKPKINIFLETVLDIIISNIFVFSLIFIIGRFINVQLVLISIIASSVGLILTIIVWNLIGSPHKSFLEIGVWASSNIDIKYPWIRITISIYGAIMLIAHPVIIGINYFSLDSYEAIQLMALKYNSIFILINYIIFLPVFIGMLASDFIDEDSRARVFLNQFGGLIAHSLFISLLFWVFNTETSFSSFPVGNLNLVYSPKLLIILIGVLFVFIVLPYFIGIQRARRLQNDFLASEASLLTKVINAIKFSTDKDLISNIEKIEKEIVDEYEKFIDSDKGVAKGIEYDKIEDKDEIPAKEKLVFQYYKIARQYDNRFKFYDFLNDTYSKIIQLKESLDSEQICKKEKTIQCNKCIEYFKSKEEDIIKNNGIKEKTTPTLWIGILVVLSPLTSQFLSEIGKYLIDILKNL